MIVNINKMLFHYQCTTRAPHFGKFLIFCIRGESSEFLPAAEYRLIICGGISSYANLLDEVHYEHWDLPGLIVKMHIENTSLCCLIQHFRSDKRTPQSSLFLAERLIVQRVFITGNV